MHKIDRKKLRENVLYFGGLKGLKIGDIEKIIGRERGFISRWTSANKKIHLDDIYNLALLFDITIDDLINTDIEKLKKQDEIRELKAQREMIERQIQYLEGECVG